MQVFPDDIVRRWDNPEIVGRVCCLDGDADEPDGTGAAQRGEIAAEAHVYWLRAADNDCMEPIGGLEVVDRAILHGDTVREVLAAGNHALGADVERVGIVVASSVHVDARELATGAVHRDVCSRRLRHAQPFRTGTFVVRDGWLGRVESWLDDLVISFADGARCRARGVSPAQLIPIECPQTAPYCQHMMVRAADPEFFRSCCETLEPATPRSPAPPAASSPRPRPASSPPAAPAGRDGEAQVAQEAQEGQEAQAAQAAQAVQAAQEAQEVAACGTAEGEATGASRAGAVLTVGRIEAVQAGEASIEWLTPCNSGASVAPPAIACDPSLLRPLVAFAHTWWNLSDNAMLVPVAGAGAGEEAKADVGDTSQAGTPPPGVGHCSACAQQSAGASRERAGNGLVAAVAAAAAAGGSSGAAASASASASCGGSDDRGSHEGDNEGDGGIRVEVVGLSTRVTVVWQSGEVSEMPASSLMLHNPGPQTFFPHDIIQLRSANDDLLSELSQVPRAGYVVSVDTAARLVRVKWLPQADPAGKTPNEKPAGSTSEVQTVSSFELSLHRSYSFRLGDAVTKVSSTSALCRASPPAGTAGTDTDADTANAPLDATGVDDKSAPRDCSNDDRDMDECSSQPASATCGGGCVGEVVALFKGRVGVAWLSQGDTEQRTKVGGGSSNSDKTGGRKCDYDFEWLCADEVQLIGNDIDAAYASAETADEYYTALAAAPSEQQKPPSRPHTTSGSMHQGSRASDAPASAEDKNVAGPEVRPASTFADKTSSDNGERSTLMESASVPVLPVAPDAWQLRAGGSAAGDGAAIEGGGGSDGATGMAAPRWRWLKGLQNSLSSLLRIQPKVDESPQRAGDGQCAREARPVSAVAAGGGAGAARVLARARSHVDASDTVGQTSDVAQRAAADGGSGVVVGTAAPGLMQRPVADESLGAAEAAAATQPFELLEAGCVPSDHAFLLSCTMDETDAAGDDRGGGGGGGGGTLAHRAWARRAHREWRQLRRGLPDDGSVHVFAFEERLDLLRAVVRGPANTPYSCALFFFDIRLPPLYPSVPPDVFFWSFGERVNPNLYENGKVCLSLLGTWSGKSEETWSAATSNLLQVLISIQGLVLVKEPYFNEPGYEAERGTARGEASSRQYDEAARLLSLQSVLRVLRSPPQCTATLVHAHVRDFGAIILQDVDALLAGRVTCNGADVTEDCQGGGSVISAGMRIALDALLPKLRADFVQIGCDCEAQ